MRTLIETWAILEGLSPGVGVTELRVDPAIMFDVYAAIEVPSGLRACYINIKRKTPVAALQEVSGLGFECKYEPASKDAYRIVLRQRDARFRDVFSVLAQDVVDRAVSANDVAAMVKVLNGRIVHWQRLLEVHGSDGLSVERQRGLWAELHFLLHVALPATSEVKAVGSWKGPDGGRQDFSFSAVAVEVKSTIASGHQKMKISNIVQLTSPGDQPLLVFHVSVAAEAVGGLSLPALVAKIRASLQGTAREEFEDKLQRAGYLQSHEPQYADAVYRVRETTFFQVRAGFPRLQEQDLASGVGDVVYSVALGACQQFRVPEHEALRLIR